MVKTASRFFGLAKGRQILATRGARERLSLGFEIRCGNELGWRGVVSE